MLAYRKHSEWVPIAMDEGDESKKVSREDQNGRERMTDHWL